MKLLHIIFYRGLFFFSMPISLWAASYNSEISLAYHRAAPYNGCKVTFQVYEGTEEAKRRVWTGQLTFYPEGLLVNVSSLSRKQVNPDIKFRYVFNPGRYNTKFNTVPPICGKSPDGFTYEELTSYMDDSIIAGNLITWSLNNYAISVQDVVDTVNSLKDNEGRFPKYKLYGYDWDDNVANCVTFSCRFLRAFGVNIDACTELTPWLRPTRGPGLSWAGYYVFGFGWTRDHVRLRNAILFIAPHHNNVRWNRGGLQSGAPRFALPSIGDVLDASDMKSVQAFIQS
jgi:hypothetical protein